MAGLATILSSSNTRGGIKKNTDSNSHEVRAKNRLRGFFHQQLKSESNVMFTSPYESRNNSRHSAVALPDIKEENISGATDSPNSSSHEDPILQKVIQVQAALDTLDHNSEHSISNTLHLRHSFASTPNLQRSSDPLPLRKSLRSLTLSKTEEDDEESRGQLSTQRSRINLQKEGSLQGSPRRGSLNKNIRRSRQTPAIGDDSPALKKVQRRSVMRDFRSSSEAILDTVQRERKRRQSFAESQNSKGHSSLTLLHLERATAMSTRDNTFSFQGKELSPSSTFHFRPKLEEALEKQRQMQEANKRAALVAMGLSVSTLGQDASLHAEEELPFEFEPDKEELDRQEQINVAVAKMDAYSDVLQDEDPFLTACQVAKQQYAQDFEYSRIQDLSHKFPLFDLDEINQGLVLGTGSFAQVIEVKGFCLKPAGVATASGKNNFTTSMRQKRRVMAGMEDQDGQSESSYEIAPLKGDNEGDNEDGASAIEGSKDGYGIGDITDDELEIADDGDDFNAASEAVDVVAQGLSNRSLFQQCRQQNKTLKKSQSSMDSSRQFIADHCHRAKEGEPSRSNARYALKQLKRKIKDDPHTMMQGIADMATETRVLSSLTEHPNLIKLRGIARGSGMPFQCDYFILLDRLYDTLSIRLQRWMHMEKQLGGVKGMLWDPKGIQRKQLWNDRVSFAFDLSSALAYLHSRHVMHRDLKPDNIGFDIRGDIKIFDFGLAKELPTVNNGGRNKFHFTAMCGSPRYMAPEVGMEEPYNELCDVYSFGILLWEMMTLKKPYGDIGMCGLISEVWTDNASALRPLPSLESTGKFLSKGCGTGFFDSLRRRPKQQQDIHMLGTPASLQDLLNSCWSYELQYRPSMAEVEIRLQRELAALHRKYPELDAGQNLRMVHTRRRSTSVFDEALHEDMVDLSSSTDHYHSHKLYNPLNLFRSNHSRVDSSGRIITHHDSISSFADETNHHAH